MTDADVTLTAEQGDVLRAVDRGLAPRSETRDRGVTLDDLTGVLDLEQAEIRRALDALAGFGYVEVDATSAANPVVTAVTARGRDWFAGGGGA